MIVLKWAEEMYLMKSRQKTVKRECVAVANDRVKE